MSLLQKAVGAVLRLMPDKAPDPLIGSGGAVGQPVSRVDGPLKVTGKARFAAEVPFENLAFAAVVYSTIARGSIASIDTAEAEAAAGVLLAMTYKNAPRLKAPLMMVADAKGAAGSNLPVMQDAKVRWNGEPVACIVAETQEQADDAAALVRVTYAAEPATTSFEAAKAKAKAPDNILGEPAKITVGDAEAASRKGAVPRGSGIHDAAPQPLCDRAARRHRGLGGRRTARARRDTDAAPDPLDPGGGLRPQGRQGAHSLALRWRRLRQQGASGTHHVLAAAASRMIGRPVRLVLSREGVFRATGGRTLTEQRVALGAKADGTLAALIHTGVAGMTDHNYCPEQFTFPARHLYAVGNVPDLRRRSQPIDMVANTFMRAPGESIGTFALECAIDELAEMMKVDPIELRRRLEPAKDPTSGLAFSSRHLVEAYQRGAERFGWDRRNRTPRALRDGDWLIGHGVATGTYPYYRMPGGAASITLTADGRAIVRMGAHEMGMGTATAQAQHAAERLGLPIEQVTLRVRGHEPAERHDGRRLLANRIDHCGRGGGKRGAGQAVAQAAPAMTRRLPVSRPVRSKSAMAVCAAGTIRRNARATFRFCAAPARARSACEASAPMPTEDVEVFDALLLRAVLRSARATR